MTALVLHTEKIASMSKVKIPKPPIEHADKFGRPIGVDNAVLYCARNELRVGKITKVTAKQVFIEEYFGHVSSYRKFQGSWQPGKCTSFINDAELTFYLLKGKKV